MTGDQIHAEKTRYIHVKVRYMEQEKCFKNYIELYELFTIIVDRLHSAAASVVCWYGPPAWSSLIKWQVSLVWSLEEKPVCFLQISKVKCANESVKIVVVCPWVGSLKALSLTTTTNTHMTRTTAVYRAVAVTRDCRCSGHLLALKERAPSERESYLLLLIITHEKNVEINTFYGIFAIIW